MHKCVFISLSISPSYIVLLFSKHIGEYLEEVNEVKHVYLVLVQITDVFYVCLCNDGNQVLNER